MTTLGATFLNRYRSLRKNEGGREMLAEVEYNFGRAFHGLGKTACICSLGSDCSDQILQVY